ncbi:SURF1 family protein [Cryptosporangium aurantiacum]|uniref:SURF1-like protein n=1 Tax=Cryptosporangium aurantiacum TaxID=134849 RepID=A0A1M7Q9U4_9ACTN|nr:SURF1 family protein [Cryptosporangium aurantiacum]SHN27200.1 Cytochrome oxidase assembly protein ShyY1 [Cryptosporangium aurantiacum]
MYRFLLSPKWVASFLLCVVAAVVCVRLAHWQLDRLDQKRAINDAITTARDASPVPASSLNDEPEYTRVRATGQYDVAREVLVRNRTQDNKLGYYVLAPLRTTDGPVLWVVRGWVAAGSGGATSIPTYGAAPGGTVTVVGRVREPESGSIGSVQVSGHNLITRITPEALQADGEPAYDAFVELISSTPADTSLSALPAPDDLDEGPHLAYAVQWYLFAGMFLVGYLVLARNYAHRDDAPRATVDADPPAVPAEAP